MLVNVDFNFFISLLPKHHTSKHQKIRSEMKSFLSRPQSSRFEAVKLRFPTLRGRRMFVQRSSIQIFTFDKYLCKLQEESD